MQDKGSSKLDSDSVGEIQEKVPNEEYNTVPEDGHMANNETSPRGNHLATKSVIVSEDGYRTGSVLSSLRFDRAAKDVKASVSRGLKSAATGLTAFGRNLFLPFKSPHSESIVKNHMRKIISEDPLCGLDIREAVSEVIYDIRSGNCGVCDENTKHLAMEVAKLVKNEGNKLAHTDRLKEPESKKASIKKLNVVIDNLFDKIPSLWPEDQRDAVKSLYQTSVLNSTSGARTRKFFSHIRSP